MKNQKINVLAITILTICFTCMLSFISFAKVIELKYNKNYKVDLDMDGKKETLKLKSKPPTAIYVNKKRIWNASSNKKLEPDSYDGAYWILCDIDTSDSYKELMLLNPNRIYIYRYKKGKIKLYCTKANRTTEQFGYVGFYARMSVPEIPGNGLIKINTLLYAENSNGNGQEMFVNLTFRIKNKKLVLVKDAFHKINSKVQSEFSQKNKKYLKTTGKKTYVYQYPREKSNKLLFTLKKGVKYKPLQIKIEKKYVFVEIKVLNSNKKGKTGWIGLDIKKVNSGDHYWSMT